MKRLFPLLVIIALTIGACSKPQAPTIGLYPAVANGDIDQLKRHLFWNTDIDQVFPDGNTALHLAVRNGDPAIVGLLLDAGADLRKSNRDGESVLQTALKNRRMRIAERLIQAGAPFEGQKLLFYLVNSGISDRDVYRLLADHGVDFNTRDDNGKTPLIRAIEQQNPSLVKQLILHGANVNQTDSNDNSPLALAKQHRVQQITRLLEMNGAN